MRKLNGMIRIPYVKMLRDKTKVRSTDLSSGIYF